MAIPNSQLETWSHQGSIKQSSDTYKNVKNVLESSNAPYSNKSYDVFLQGSYGNDTNIYAESDVDIVIRLNDCMQSDLTKLPQDQKDAYHNTYPNAVYTHSDFKSDIIDILNENFGSDFSVGNKAIEISANGNRRKSDVIVAIQYRRYYKFMSRYDQSYDKGICFFDSNNNRIANYPEQHSKNLTSKHQNTDNWLKPMVRVFKNIREKLVEMDLLKKEQAPSYYIEGLLYNVPDSKFTSSYEDCFINIMNWIQKEADKNKLVCANEQYYLLRKNSQVAWSPEDCEDFLKAVINLWNKWQ
jgi:hypothetical protein